MRTPHILFSVLLGLGLSACGSSEPASAPMQEASTGGEAAERPELPPDLAAFHDALAPVWHHDPGEERAQGACEASQTYIQLSANVEDGDDLRSAARRLAAVCGSGETATIEQALTTVHEAFHAVMEARGGEECSHTERGEDAATASEDSEAPAES